MSDEVDEMRSAFAELRDALIETLHVPQLVAWLSGVLDRWTR